MPNVVTDFGARHDTRNLQDALCGLEPKRVLDRLDEPIPEAGEPRLWNGRPCILFGALDLGEDWAGEYVNLGINPFALLNSPKISTQEFWSLVRKGHGV
jgi:hypothetical protein